jgi:tetratricopeptide (TPR) repeat protein
MKKPISRPKAALRQAAEPQVASPPPANQAPAAVREPGPPADGFETGGQAEAFESAVRLFHSGQFRAARDLFQRAARGSSREVAHTALLHARMCERRLGAPEPAPKSAEDHYNYAVALVNQRRLETAEQHLQQALAQAPDSDHLYYVLALCRGLGGDLAGAYTHMKRAIELHPRNRMAARNDPDFAEIGQQPPLAELLYPERTRSG